MKSWLVASFLSMVVVTPVWLSINFFSKNFGVSSVVFMWWYFAGLVLAGPPLFQMLGMTTMANLFWCRYALPILLIGAIPGLGANLLIYWAVPLAHNPALPIAIVSSSSALVYLVAIALGALAPSYFTPTTPNVQQFLGIILTVIGLVLLSVR